MSDPQTAVFAERAVPWLFFSWDGVKIALQFIFAEARDSADLESLPRSALEGQSVSGTVQRVLAKPVSPGSSGLPPAVCISTRPSVI